MEEHLEFRLESERQYVIDVAKSWLRTPYHHMGRVKGAGVDCATLLAEVYHEASVVKNAVEIGYYPIEWNLHRSEELYLQTLLEYVKEIDRERAREGDIVLFHCGRTWSHGAIIISWPVILHAVVNSNVQLANVETDGMLSHRKMRFFSPWTL